MNKPFAVLSSLAACALVLAACQQKQVAKGPAPDYQAPVSQVAAPAGNASACFDDAALSAFRVRMVQQELTVGVLACQGPGGKRLYEEKYAAFLAKFNPELSGNAVELQAAIKAKRRNFDVVITEIANRTAQRPTQDPQFCVRHERALDWALSSKVTSLTQVPSPYDLGPEMNVFACSGAPARK